MHARLPRLDVRGYGTYAGVLRQAVLALKDGRRDVAEALGRRLAPSIVPGTTLVPVPTTRARTRVRGVDGVRLVADVAARLRGARVAVPLRQVAGDAQRGKDRLQRLAARGRFACSVPLGLGAAVTLIDDVCTTGATLLDCRDVLEAAGYRVEGAVVVAIAKDSHGLARENAA